MKLLYPFKNENKVLFYIPQTLCSPESTNEIGDDNLINERLLPKTKGDKEHNFSFLLSLNCVKNVTHVLNTLQW